FPSVWRDTGCRSHFIIWYGHIVLFDDVGGGTSFLPAEITDGLKARVREQLTDDFVHFRDIAKLLNAIPWDVQYVCKRLVETGYAREGSEQQMGCYARRRGGSPLFRWLSGNPARS
ncbi:MAG TPA: hypothetical protein VMF32_04125, partial [Xanthobacteraceae bacterium]|nr:hypothetical protein [Xanthobacteraceae bacterium]